MNEETSAASRRGALSRGERVATIDIGTNSVLLLVAEVDENGALVPIDERATITRLGEGVDKTRRLSDAAIARTLECLANYGDAIRAAGARRADAVGTSAMRDAGGGSELRARAKELLGFEPRVISGDAEARLTFSGALSGLGVIGAASVFDIGGGSTEIIRGDATTRRIDEAKSLDIGSVRLTERHVKSDPPTDAEIAAIERDIESALASAPTVAGDLVGVAGTVTTIAAIAKGIDPYDASKIHGAVLERSDIERVAALLESLKQDERVELPGLSPKRADVIIAGTRICLAIARRSSGGRVLVSDRGVRWGLAEDLAKGDLSALV